MKIRIERTEKIELIKALKDGFLDTDKIPALKDILDKAVPNKILTKEQAKAFLLELESEC